MRARCPALIGLVLAVVFGAACAPSAPSAPSPHASGAATPRPIAWSTSIDRQHPLVGRIWSVREARFVEEAQVLSALRGYVLLGEKHDNPDHHVLQARMLRAMVEAGRRPVVAFEMFDVDHQAAIEASRREHPRDAAWLAQAVSWDKAGWGPWEAYAPIVQIALDAELPILATGLPRSRMRALMKPGGTAAGADGGAEEPLDVGVALTPDQESSLREELRESHCGHLPEAHIGGMIRFQRARDAAMAKTLVAAARASHAGDGVLVAGTGHTRRDRGAGRDLSARDPERPITSIAFVEVDASITDPPAYAARWNTSTLPFDFVWFTPRATDEDPCAAFAH